MIFFFGFLLLYPLFFLPAFGIHAEMLAENATNYFNTAHTMPFLQGIQVTDYGYLPLIPRVLSYLIEWLGVSPSYVPMAYDLVASFFIALCVCSFVSSWGESVVRRTSLRYVFAFLIFMLPDYELKAFINFTYWLFIPLFLLTLRAWSEPESFNRKSWFGFVVLASLAILSKPLFFVLVPVFFLLGIKLLWSRRFILRAVLLGLIPLAVVVQLKVSEASHQLDIEAVNAKSFIYGLAYVPVAVVEKIFGHIIVHNGARLVLFSIGLGFGFLFLWHIFKKTVLRERRELWTVFFIAAVIIYFNAFICLRTYAHYYQQISQFNLRPVMSLLAVRHWFFANLAAYFFVLKFYDVFPKSLAKLRLFFLLLLLFAGKHFSFSNLQMIYSSDSLSNGDWQSSLRTYGDLKSSESFCIPINPMSWYYLKNCHIDGDQEEFRRLFHIDERQWSEPLTSYAFSLNNAQGAQAHWIAFHSKLALTSEDFVSVKIDGKEAPIRLFSEKTSLTYVWLSRLPLFRQVDVIFRKPVQLEIGSEKQVLKMVAIQGAAAP